MVTEQAIQLIIGSLEQATALTRSTIIKQITALGADAVPTLSEHLLNGSARVREGVATALGDIGDVRAIESLIDAMTPKKERDYECNDEAGAQVAAILALGKIGDIAAFDPLVNLLFYVLRTDIPISWYVMDALEMIGDRRAISHLEQLFDHPDADVRKTAKRVAKKLARQKPR